MKLQGISTITTASGVLEDMALPSEVVLPQPRSGVKDNSPVDTPENETEKFTDWKAGRQEWLIMIVLLIVSLMASIDATILVPVLPVLASELHGSAIDTFWAGTSYLLANAVFQPFFAALSDIFGRQQLLFLSVLLFTVGTIVCCTARNFTDMLAGRSVQGIGGGGIIVLVLVIMTDIIPLRQRPKYNSFIQMAWAFGTITGPLIGGGIVKHTTWRWIFYLNFPFCAAALILTPLVLRFKMQTSSLKTKLSRVDWVGGILFIASLTSFLIAITWGGVQFEWGSYQTLVPLILGAFGLCLTVAWERWLAKEPFLRLFLFDSRSSILAYICCILQGFLMLCGLYYMPFFLASVKSLSPIQTGVGLLPVTASLLPTSMIVGIVMTRTGRLRWALWSGWAVMCLAYGLMIILDENSSTLRWVWIFIVVGFAHGLIMMPMIFGIQAMARSEDVAYAAAMYAFLRTFGQSIGVAIGGTVFQNLLTKHLRDAGLPDSIGKDAEGFLKELAMLPNSSPFKMQVKHAYGQAFHAVFGVMLAAAALGLICSLGIGKFSLDKRNESQHVLRKKGEQTGSSEKYEADP
ncbi:hypothetical protein EYC80_000617 [Monilinia laxa]|uniref:Major facilitator superfamily (MFS) profile domain-containing protein n=1 Tax=Monilinia laxa TaxID=61186 RepID=A0A5N6KB89_MONLA|nr:hypothetical protein EYC80_000617 [Monilinia laxa]